jgi:uncharacterized protein YegP (UPF0339 family)
MEYRVYKDTAGYWRWTFYASNGRKIADSAEGYHNKEDCVNGINLICNSGGVPIKYLN